MFYIILFGSRSQLFNELHESHQEIYYNNFQTAPNQQS